MTKLDFKKTERAFYQPKKLSIVDLPPMNFMTIDGAGAPSGTAFQTAISLLYPVAYAISMSYKNAEFEIPGFEPFVVPPLEGLWTSQTADYQGNKDELIWKIMLRLPDFVTPEILEKAKKISRAKKNMDFSAIKFEQLTDGPCVQMLHLGSYDEENTSFDKMANFADEQGYQPLYKNFHHREIYLSDFRKTAPEKLKTVLRQFITKK